MLLETPPEPSGSIWEGPLEAADEQAVRSLGAAGDPEAESLEVTIRSLPVVSLGQPETWALTDLYSPDAMPSMIRAKLAEADFFLVRLNCSFRSTNSRSRIEWARFWARFVPDQDGRQPTAFDVYPREVTVEVEHDTTVTLSPSLAFSEVKASAGEMAFGVKYTAAEPVVTSSGTGETAIEWSYEMARGSFVRGTKWMYALLKAPKGMPSARVELDVVADVITPRGVLPTALARRSDAEAALSAQLWDGELGSQAPEKVNAPQ